MKVITIGRSAGNNDIIVNDVNVSRNHLQIIQDDNGNYSLVDLGSTNGTYVNGKRISGEVYLQPGDQVMIGTTMLPWQSYFAGAPAPQSATAAQATSRDNASKRNLTWIYYVIGGVLLLLIAGIVIWLAFGDKPKSPEPIILPADTALIRMQDENKQTQEETDASIIALEQALRDYKAAKDAAAKAEAKKKLDNAIDDANNKVADAQKAASNAQTSANKAREAAKKAGNAVEASNGDPQVKKFATNAQTAATNAQTAANNANTAAEKAKTAAEKAKKEAAKDNLQSANSEVKIALTQFAKAKEEEFEAAKAATAAEQAATAAEQAAKEKKNAVQEEEKEIVEEEKEIVEEEKEEKKKDNTETTKIVVNKSKTDKQQVKNTDTIQEPEDDSVTEASLDDQFNHLFNRYQMRPEADNEYCYAKIYEKLGWDYGTRDIKDVPAARKYLKNVFDDPKTTEAEKKKIINAMREVL